MTPRAWAAFVTVSVVWGIPYFLIKVAIGEVSPVAVAWSRLLLCALLLLPLALARGTLGPAWKQWRWLAAVGVSYMALPFTLIPFGERFISSSLAAIMVATVPLLVAVMTLRAERPPLTRVIGLLVGFAGVAALVGVDVGGRPAELIGVGCLAVVALCYAVGPVLTSRRLAASDPIATVTIASGASVATLTPLLLFSLPNRVPSPGVILALITLGVLCSAVGLAAYFYLIGVAGPGRASIVTYLNPAIAVLVGVAFLHERITPGVLAGLFMILAGSWLATRGRATSRRAERPGASRDASAAPKGSA
jgi:drug/metabolite transporter (DMT)-like permease